MGSNKFTLSFSSLKQFDKSPSHFLQYKRRLFKETPAMRLGTLTHLSILEPDEFAERVITTDLSKRTKAYKEFVEENGHKEIVTNDEMQTIQDMTAAVNAMTKARRLLDQAIEKEQRKSWEYRGHVFNGTPDAVTPTAVVDLKTTRDATPHRFESDAFRMLYHVQAACYLSGLQSLGYDVRDYYIVAVETTAPYPVSVFKLSTDLIERGFQKLDVIIDEFEAWDGTEQGYHPADEQVLMNIPTWAQG